ncbi:MAM and LDL-receptor class A domain-containing protein 1-like [Pecten maximus]|uniref:MAM and LDL-receptor class A domain-containing protein 1-like n=1 Tax=Pecten maximus TaxID=6579 RepID=UPI001458BBB5|nr:MAM and LDL-receptor class A domain-containing protein 1-like [Pecten maximus]
MLHLCSVNLTLAIHVHGAQSTADNFNWTLTTDGHGPSTGPSGDHSDSGNGHYLYTEGTGHTPGNKAILNSPLLPPTTQGGNCFIFYYHMFGPTVGTLKVYTILGGSRQLRGSFTGTHGNHWNLAQYNIQSHTDYQIQLEVTTKGTFSGDVSIDSINMDNVNCANSSLAHHSTDISCTFESGLCGWSQDHADNFNWLSGRGSNRTGITTDHTTNTASGHFLYADASSPARQGWKARLISPQFPSSTGECLRFYMFMTGTPHATLSVYTRSASGTEISVWTRTDNVQGNTWVPQEVTLTSQSKFQVIIEALRGSSSTSDIAIDDLTISPGTCRRAGACNFEQGLCGYTNLQGDQFDWTRGQGNSPSAYTGPSVDHTTGTTNGHYMFIESSSPQRLGDKAWLASDPIQPTTGSCLTFWYNMNGAGIGTLNVYYMNSTNNKIFSMSGNHGDVWMKGNVTLVSTQPFKILFEAIRGQNYRGDIALDDIDVAPGYCSLQTTASPVTTPQPTLATLIGCNFESGFCNWNQDHTDTFDWTMDTAGTNSVGTGPKFDHTLQNSNGHYIYIEASGKRANSTARLVSPPVSTTGKLCVQFWYNMYGQHINKLNLYTKSNNVLSPVLWTKAGNQGNRWIEGQVDIVSSSPGNQVVFEGTAGLGYQGDISLDDIKILNGACQGSASCDFEQSSICGYQQDLNDNFDWTWGHGSTGSRGTGPTNDHTYATTAGHYMYTETSAPRVQGDKANLRSPSYPASQQKCLTFWYHMYGQDIGTLNIYISTYNQLGNSVWSLYGNQGNTWHKGQVTVSSRSSFQVVFSGIRGSGFHGDIAIDDINMGDGACAGQGTCDFERDLCSWTQRQDDSFDWLRRKGPTPSVGYYLFIETSRPRKMGDNAVIQSQLIPNQPQLCFSFWYNMHGQSVGNLNISMQIKGSTKNLKKSITGDQGTGWKQGQVDMSDAYDDFMILVEAGVGSGYQGDIAIDDLRLDTTACGSSSVNGTFNCTGGQHPSKVVPLNKVCNFMVDCPYASDETNCGACSFDQDYCSWMPNLQGVFTWVRGNKRSSDNTGPAFDHTQGNQYGYYAYVDAALGTSRSIATLTGPLLQPCSSTCQIQFWYSMYGRGIGTLSVVIVEGGQNTTIWTQRGNQGDQWNKATVDIGRVGRPFQLMYTATRTFNNLGNIAIDDLQLINCNFPAIQKTCSANQARCTRGSCVPKTDLCDFSDDCGDSSDEQSCSAYPARCDFETSICSWTQDKSDNFDWTRANDHTASYGTGPSRDHTRGTAAGYYMYIESSRPRKPGDKARLLSQAFKGVVTSTTGQSQACTLRLYYHMFGRTIGALNVYTRTAVGGPMKIIWQKAGNVGDFFERVDIPIFETNPFQVVIEGVTGQGYQGDIAVDDLSMTPGCIPATTPLVTGTPGPVTTPGPCGNGSFSCPGRCINQNQVCDFISQCSDNSDEANCGTCTFETNQCGWSDASSGRYNWHRFQGVSPGTGGPRGDHTTNSPNGTGGPRGDHTTNSPNGKYVSPGTGGPRGDHTTNSPNGYYMLVEGSSGTFYSRARMSTVVLGPTAPSCQVQFFYHMYGIAAGNIQLSVVNSKRPTDSTVIWYKTGNQGNGWKQATADIGSLPAGYKVQFDALPSKSFQTSGIPQSDMAIDDVKFVACNPTQIVNNSVFNLNCSFESGLCGYFQETADDFDWTLTNLSSPTVGTGPDRDHTTGTGFYIYIETSAPRHAGQRARITSGIQRPTQAQGVCLTFWYHMFGAHVNTLNIYQQHPQVGNLSLIWSRSKTQGNVWRKGQRTIISNQPYQIVFEGLVGVSWQGDIALDDISVVTGPCPAPAVCDFEADFCGWTQDKTDDYDWTRDRNGTSSTGTGPAYDHTTESQYGYYIYTEASSPLVMGNKARLISPNFTPLGSFECLHFWYHMYGQNVGTLNVYLQPSSGAAKSTIFSRTGNQVNLWLYATVQLTQTIDYQIILEGVRGNGYQGDIAIDDIRITAGKCKPVGTCDFELDTCGYGNTRTGDQFDWLRSAGGTLSRNTGPSVDHTTNSDQGFYMLVRANGRQAGDRAWLYSQYFPASPASCLSFWYHMYGKDIGILRVYQPTSTGTLLVWNATHNQGNVWRQAKVDLNSSVSYQVTFDGEVGTGYQGDMALDDIVLNQGRCSDQTTTVPTTAVISTVTYPPTAYDCNFDQNDLCTWTQDHSDIFDWTLHRGHTSSFGTGPSADHTTGSANGYYAYIESSGRHTNDTARLISQSLVLMTSGKCFKFWYHMFGADVYKLNVYAKQGGNMGNPAWTKIGYQGNYWKFASVYLTPETLASPSQQSRVQVIIEGVVGNGYQGDIAIDDISVNDGPCPPSSYYMYIESSAPRVAGDKARLLSPSYPATTGQCLTWYYHMYGSGTGSLAVRLFSQGQLKPAIWTRSRNQGNMWRVAQATINSDSPFQTMFLLIQVVFEAITRQQTGDIAIDDISIRNGPCAGPADCNFESNLCAWSNVEGSGDDFDWLRNKGDTTSTQTGPSVDHTLGTREGITELNITPGMVCVHGGLSSPEEWRQDSTHFSPSSTYQSCLLFFLVLDAWLTDTDGEFECLLGYVINT